jgi:hypothetical protein
MMERRVRVMVCLMLVLPFAVVSAHAATGRATVTGQGAQCPAQYVGRTATGFVNGMTHNNCTAAKNIARATLRARVPQGCAAYITSTARCAPP